MDLKNYNLSKSADAGADLVIEDPITGEELDVTITLLGSDSAAYRNKAREMQRDRISKMAKGRNKKLDLSVSEKEECELLAACTVGWDGIELDGVEVAFSYDEAVKLYLDFTWIKEQVDSFIGDRANFLAK